MAIPGCVDLDLEISASEIEAGAFRVLNHIRPEWRQEDVIILRFTKGLMNHLVGCRLKDDPDSEDMILVRVYGEGSEVLTDRIMEIICHYVLSKSGKAKPLYARFKNGIAYGYMPGECVTTATVRDPHVGRMIAENMAAFGNIPSSPHVRDLPEEFQTNLKNQQINCFQWIRTCIDKTRSYQPWKEDPEIPDDAVLSAEVDLLERELTDLGSPVIFCHNDIHTDNIIYDKRSDRCSLVDFELSGFNYQAADIALHFCEWTVLPDMDFSLYPDKETQLVWLTHYLTEYNKQQGAHICQPNEKELLTLYVQVNKFALLEYLFMGVWALSQNNNVSGTFDNITCGKVRLQEYYRRKDELLKLKLTD